MQVTRNWREEKSNRRVGGKFQMAATAQLLKLFSRKRKAVEEEMHSFQRVNDEEARRRFTEELDNTFCILLLKDRWLYVSRC